MIQRAWRFTAALAATAVAAFTIFGSVPVYAATFTYTDPNCASFSVTDVGNGGIAVQCSRLDCAISASTLSPSSNQNVTLTASCQPPSGSTSYSWTKLNGGDASCPGAPAAGSSTTVIAPNTNAASCSYRLTASDPTFGVATRTVTLNWGAVAAPAGCSISANPQSLPIGGGQVTLTISCSGGGSASAYSWSGGFAQGQTSQQVTGTLTATTAFNASASNGGGSAPASLTVTVATGGGQTGGGNVQPCAGFANTRVLDIDWNNPQTVLSASQGGMGPNDAVVVRFTVPATAANSVSAGRILTAEYQADLSDKIGALSTTACDFSPSLAPGAMGQGTTVTENFFIGGNNGYYPSLQPGSTYFFNIRNGPNPSGNCQGGNCNLYVQLLRPGN